LPDVARQARAAAWRDSANMPDIGFTFQPARRQVKSMHKPEIVSRPSGRPEPVIEHGCRCARPTASECACSTLARMAPFMCLGA